MNIQTTMIVSPTFGSFVFDAVFSTSHTSNVTATRHPVQSGASVTDHSFLEPDEVSIEIGMTDAAVSATEAHSVNAYSTLKSIMERREPVTLLTRLGTYRDMLITSISAPDDFKTMNALRASIFFSQIRIVSVAALTIREVVTASKSEAEQGSEATSGEDKDPLVSAKTESKSNSTKSQTNPDKSVLRKLADALG